MTPSWSLGTARRSRPAGRAGRCTASLADTGAPIAFIDDFGGVTPSIDQVPCTFAFDLNTGEVSLHGSFPGPPSALHFGVEFLTLFQGNDGKNMLFYSGTSSDHAGYIIAVQLVAAS